MSDRKNIPAVGDTVHFGVAALEDASGTVVRVLLEVNVGYDHPMLVDFQDVNWARTPAQMKERKRVSE